MTEGAPDARVIIIPPTQVGKTALLNRFVDKTYTPTTSSTVTPVFSPSRIETSSGRVVSLQLWDTAGQEKYQSIGKVFYRNANYAVICFESSDADPLPSIQKWKENILSIEPGCVLFLASTKFDTVSADEQLQVIQKGEELKTQIGAVEFFATSALTGDGVEPLFTAVANQWAEQLTKQTQANVPQNKLSSQNQSQNKQNKKGCC